jgi:hypothetical protein
MRWLRVVVVARYLTRVILDVSLAHRLAGVIRPIASSVEAVVAQGQRSPPTDMAGQADVIR